MPRETKAERIAREVAEREAVELQERNEYPNTLMSLLQRSTALGWDIVVRDGLFTVVNNRDEYTFTYAWDKDSMNAIYSLQCDLDIAEEKKREEERKYLLRNAALAKLSVEERQVLGLK
jgi:hypothetical protein